MAFQIFLNALYYSLSTMPLVVGLALMFGIMRIVMLAYGELFMIGMYIIWYLTTKGWNYGPASITALAVVIILGIVIERYLFRAHRGYLLPCLVISIGLILIMQTGVLLGVDAMGYGLSEKSVRSIIPDGVVRVFGAVTTWERVALGGAGLLVLLVGIAFIRWTRVGKSMRAVVQDPGTAAALGVNLNRLTVITMVIACGLAGIYAILRAPMFAITPQVGFGTVLIAFLAVIIGGAGSMGGAVLATFILGFTTSIVTSLIGAREGVIASYLMTVFVLMARPNGLFGYQIEVR